MIDCLPDTTETACLNCGWIKPEKIVGWPRRNCSRSPDLQPAAERLGVTLADAAHYFQALARWTAAGFPVREQAEVERIEREICRPCEEYRDGRCAKCSCQVNSTSWALATKLKMKTEVCPLGYWI